MKQENEYKKLTCTNKKINDQAVVKKKKKDGLLCKVFHKSQDISSKLK